MTRWRWAWSGLLCVVALWGCKHPTAPASQHEPRAHKSADSATKAPAPTTAPVPVPKRSVGASGLTALRVGAVELKLEGCVLTLPSPSADGRFDFGFPEPCHFTDDGRGAAQKVTTRDGVVLIVESSRPLPPNDSGVRDCDTRLRGVVVRNRAVFVSQSIQKVASCAPGPWDLLMFHVFAAHTISIGRGPHDGE